MNNKEVSQKNRRGKKRQKQHQQCNDDDNNNSMTTMTMMKNKQINQSIVCAISSNSSPSSHLSRISMNIHKFFRSFFIFTRTVCACVPIAMYEVRDEFCVCADDNHIKRLPSLPGPFSPRFRLSVIYDLHFMSVCFVCS